MGDLGRALAPMLKFMARIDRAFVTTVLLLLKITLRAIVVGFVLGFSVGAALGLGPVFVAPSIGVSAATFSVSRWMQAYPIYSRSAVKSFSGTIGMD